MKPTVLKPATVLTTALAAVLSLGAMAQTSSGTASGASDVGPAGSTSGNTSGTTGAGVGDFDDEPSGAESGSAGRAGQTVGGVGAGAQGQDDPTDAEADPDDDGARSTVPEYESDEIGTGRDSDSNSGYR